MFLQLNENNIYFFTFFGLNLISFFNTKMKKDIPEIAVEDVGIAIVKEKDENDNVVWNSYLINLKDHLIEGVIVTSTGYGEIAGEPVKTSTLRHFLNEVSPKSFVKIEPILEDVLSLSNEYWLSFYENKALLDKKFIFLPETIIEENFVTLPILKKKGVLIK